MATAEMAAMLDELMGRHRNAMPDEKIEEITWEDDSVCKFYLVDFCPHEVFVNTKVDLGPCPNIHKEKFRQLYRDTELNIKKLDIEDEFIRFCQKMVTDLGHKIKRSKDRIALSNMEQQASAVITQEKQEEIEEQIKILSEKINGLVDKAEQAGCEGDVEEAQGVLKLCDQLKQEREQLKQQIGIKPIDQFSQSSKPMEVCETCGSFLIINDAQSRIDDHINGKQHIGYSKLKESLENLLELRKQRRRDRDQEREKERDRASEERKKKREERENESEQRANKDRENKSRGSRDKRSRSRERRRSRSRDRKRSRDRNYRRSRSRDRRRSRSRDRHRRRHY